MSVYVAQVLCPQRHAIVAFADVVSYAQDVEAIRATTMEALDAAFTADFQALGVGRLNPWCGICGAPRSTWSVEVAITGWQTLEEAEPHLRAAELEQIATRAAIDELKGKAKNN